MKIMGYESIIKLVLPAVKVRTAYIMLTVCLVTSHQTTGLILQVCHKFIWSATPGFYWQVRIHMSVVDSRIDALLGYCLVRGRCVQ